MTYRLFYKLLHDSEAVRNVVATRIFAENAPAGVTGACIVLRIISGSAEYGLDGETDCAMPIVQVDCYDETATRAEALYQKVRNRLSGYLGLVQVLDSEGAEQPVSVHELTILRPGALVEEPRDASDRWRYRWSADFNVFHDQSVPTLT